MKSTLTLGMSASLHGPKACQTHLCWGTCDISAVCALICLVLRLGPDLLRAETTLLILFPGHPSKAFMCAGHQVALCQNLAWYISKVFLKKMCLYFQNCIKMVKETMWEPWNRKCLAWLPRTICFYLTCALSLLFLLAGVSIWIPTALTVT